MPAEAIKLQILFEDVAAGNQIDDIDHLDSDTVEQIPQIASEMGFHRDPHDKSMRAGGFVFQPFENTKDNRELLQQCVEKLEEQFPKLDISYGIGEGNDPRTSVAKKCDITVKNIEKGDNDPDTAADTVEDSESPDWRASLDYSDGKSKQRVGKPRDQSSDKASSTGFDDRTEQDSELPEDSFNRIKKTAKADDEHQIHSYADIEHTIMYTVDENSEELVFESMERGGLGDDDGLAYALTHNEVHCTCGETNMTKKEAIEHLHQIS